MFMTEPRTVWFGVLFCIFEAGNDYGYTVIESRDYK